MTAAWRHYDEAAAAFDRDRSRLIGEENYLREVDAALETATPRLLDLGCGTGRPIAEWFIERGWEVTGVDAAGAMIALCRERFPEATWIEHDMRRSRSASGSTRSSPGTASSI
jgi:SAM-dependent methyltransferase